MIDKAYLERTAGDLQQRVGSLVLNNQTVAIRSVTRNGTTVVVTTEPVVGITKVTSLRLLDERGGLITERAANLAVIDNQILEFQFEFSVRGGA
ncbi:hypothetical protein P4U99_02930 [Brevibacillus agri]|uniref:hypothetical protein n=1 Tax=Brevibacillus agri TaxID=51101 RepID=UPI002E1ABB1A|nr:hypothetical protein [Brevibacillus agri]MED1654414.1 hypothetical protein [Brevibacillus agri]MED1688097.1 hypothetical protein [Brevibacillus agri]MED1691173.1 hypothetical protein [Brevibacillus agri]MED1699409.1 hypothetical protein [Brevibacillus agri]